VTPLTPAPVARLTVVAAASADTEIVPVPLASVMAPLVDVMFKVPDPLCTVVVEAALVDPIVTSCSLADVPSVKPPVPQRTAVVLVVLADPTVTVLAAAPVPNRIVVASELLEIAIVPVTLLTFKPPPLVLIATEPEEPDRISVVDKTLPALPKTTVLSPEPVPIFRVELVPSLAIFIVPVPDATVIVPLFESTEIPPLPEAILVVLVLLDEPIEVVLSAPPVPTFTVAAAASAEILIFPPLAVNPLRA
jgi:hypothetical protein